MEKEFSVENDGTITCLSPDIYQNGFSIYSGAEVVKFKIRGFEVAKGWEDKDIHMPVRSTTAAAAYDVEAAEDVTIPVYEPGIKPTLIPTGLKAYCQPNE